MYNVGAVRYISIHAAREGGDKDIVTNHADKVISIHAAREGGDTTRVPERHI